MAWGRVGNRRWREIATPEGAPEAVSQVQPAVKERKRSAAAAWAVGIEGGDYAAKVVKAPTVESRWVAPDCPVAVSAIGSCQKRLSEVVSEDL